MATPRLLFLYPNLFRSIKSCEPNTLRSLRNPPSPNRSRRDRLPISQYRGQETLPQRYGPAAGGDPRLPPPSKPKDPLFSIQQEPKKEAAKPGSEEKEAKTEPASDGETKANSPEPAK